MRIVVAAGRPGRATGRAPARRWPGVGMRRAGWRAALMSTGRPTGARLAPSRPPAGMPSRPLSDWAGAAAMLLAAGAWGALLALAGG